MKLNLALLTGLQTVFFLALKYTTRFILKRFLNIEPSGINCQDSNGCTMLMLNGNDPDTFTLLCEYKPDINLLNDDGENVLLHIFQNRLIFTPSRLKLLLELGVDVNSVNSKGETAIVVAIKQALDPYGLDELFQAGANVPPPIIDGENIFIRAIQDERLSIADKILFLEVLMKYGADVSAKDSEGRNAMYCIIQEHFKNVKNSDEGVTNFYWLPKLEELLIMLLQQNCEVQGLNETFERDLEIDAYRTFTDKLDIISTFARYGKSVMFLKELVDRGLYSWTTQRELCNRTKDSMSPLTAYLSRLCSPHTSAVPDFGEILSTCKYLLSIGVDASHRSLNKNFRFIVSKYWTRDNGTSVLQITEELIYPDALFFLAQMTAANNDCKSWLNTKYEHVAALEELLRLLLRYWPYPPLYLILIGVEYDEDKDKLTLETYPGNLLFLNLLMKIGGAVPLGSLGFRCIKDVMEELAQYGDDCQATLDSFLQLDGGIPTLRSLSRAAFRASVKKMGPTGLDFSEYRVLCQGEMVPLPEKIANFLEFRD